MSNTKTDLNKLLEEFLARKGAKVPVTSRIDEQLHSDLLKIKKATGKSIQVLLDVALRLLVKVYEESNRPMPVKGPVKSEAGGYK